MNEAKNAEPSTVTNGNVTPRAGGAWWRLPLLLTVVLAALIAARASRMSDRSVATRDAAATQARRDALPAPASVEGKRVSLVLDFGGGKEQRFDDVAWHEGMTIDDVMTEVSKRSNGPMYRVTGDGQSAFVVGIGDAINEDGGGRFWTYEVNGVRGDRSFAVFDLQPGDRVLWTFGSQQ